MLKRKLGVGFIGGGFIGQFHLRSWVSVRDADIVAICDRNLTTANEAAQIAKNLNIGNPKVYTHVSDLVKDAEVDAVWILTPNFTRIEIMEEIVNTIKSGNANLIGVCCEKPLGRNLAEAKKMLELAKSVNLLDGYLENQLFMPSVLRGKDLIWKRGASIAGRPYLARAAEEHSGPHMPWFWEGELQGGGVLNDMMCHSVETARFILTDPSKSRESLIPKKITAHTECLKWQMPKYAQILSDNSNGKTDYLKKPAEDYARSVIQYEDDLGNPLIVETTTSWCYMGAGLRLSMELLGPEYSLQVNSLDTEIKMFLSRNIKSKEGEDMIEKQNAEIGLMPIVPNEENAYGYDVENRHMVQSFLEGKRPSENFDDGVKVTELLMAAYMSAEQERTIDLPNVDLENFIPKVAKGQWNPRNK